MRSQRRPSPEVVPLVPLGDMKSSTGNENENTNQGGSEVTKSVKPECGLLFGSLFSVFGWDYLKIWFVLFFTECFFRFQIIQFKKDRLFDITSSLQFSYVSNLTT